MKVFKSKQLTHLKEEVSGQQAWPAANFCFLNFESNLFFPSFLFLNSPQPELKKSQNSSVARHCHIAALLRVHGMQCPLQAFSAARLLAVHCEALAKSEKMCKNQSKPLHWQRKDCAHQWLHQSGAALQVDWKDAAWAALLSLTERKSQHVSWVLHTHRKQENILQVHHCCSPTTKLSLEHLTVKQWMKMQLKMKGANYAL